MTKEQFAKAMTYLGVVFNKEFTSSQVSVWYEYFNDVDEITFKNAIKQIAVKQKFLPAISDLVEMCAEVESKKRFEILDLMYKDGYFRKCDYGEISPEHELRNYEKATMWLSENIIPRWLLEDMKKYGYKVPIAYTNAKELKAPPLLLEQ